MHLGKQTMQSKWTYAAEHAMSGGSEHGEKPKKEIDHIKSYKSDTKGDVIHEHHHKHPEHHPVEKHTTRGDDEMAAHMMQNMGTPNPGEAEADAGTPDAAPAASPDASAPQGAPAVAAPAGPIPGAGA
jgi:hypothetical protein